MKKILITRRLLRSCEDKAKEIFDANFNLNDELYSQQKLIELSKGYDGILSSLTDKLDAETISKLPDTIKIISNFAVGFGNIDLEAAKNKGIAVTNTPDVLTDATAEIGVLLILGACRRASEGIEGAREGGWKWSADYLIGKQLTGARLGILGMGRIGQAVAIRAKSFGLKIHYHNRRQLRSEIEDNLSATYWSNINSMLENVDILSIHVPHTPATFHLLNGRRLKCLKKTAFIINTARGEIIDEDALTRMLRAGQIAGAGLDVYENGRNINPRLKSLKNVLLLPHMGSATTESRIEMGERVIINIKAFLDGHRPPDQVLPHMI